MARWYDERPVAGDTWLAALILVAFVLPADTDVTTDLAFSVALVACVPFRRRAPVAVLTVVSALCGGTAAVTPAARSVATRC